MLLPPKLFQVATQTGKKTSTLGGVCLGYSWRTWLRLPAWPSLLTGSNHQPPLTELVSPQLQVTLQCFFKIQESSILSASLHKSYFWGLSSALLPCVELAPVFSGPLVAMVAKQPGNTPSVVWHRSCTASAWQGGIYCAGYFSEIAWIQI